MKQYFVASVVVLATLISVSVSADDTANQFVDQIINALKAQQNFDPLKIEDHKMAFHKTVGLIDFKGDIVMRHTVITGLGHIKRNGDATLDNKNGSFLAKLRLGDNNIKVTSDISISLDNLIHPNLKVENDIGDIDVLFSASVDSNGKFALDEFDIDDFEHVKIRVHGLSLLDPLIDVIGELYVFFLNEQARKMITNVLRPIIEEEIKNFKM